MSSGGPKNYLAMIGNPGAGKSTLQDLYAGEAVFDVGLGDPDIKNAGGGQTMTPCYWPYHPSKGLKKAESDVEKQKWHDAKDVLIDLPGLGDLTKSKEAAAHIQDALQEDGMYTIIFVVTVIGRRVQQADVHTMKLVMECLGKQCTNYGIIVNQMKKSAMKDLTEEVKAAYLHNINAALPHPTNHIHFAPWNKDLDDLDVKDFKKKMENKEIALDRETRLFICFVPPITVKKEFCSKLKMDDEKMAEIQAAALKQEEEYEQKMIKEKEKYVIELDNVKKDMVKAEEERNAFEARVAKAEAAKAKAEADAKQAANNANVEAARAAADAAKHQANMAIVQQGLSMLGGLVGLGAQVYGAGRGMPISGSPALPVAVMGSSPAMIPSVPTSSGSASPSAPGGSSIPADGQSPSKRPRTD